MFEEEKEIRLHDFKKIRYLMSCIKNTVRYRNKRVSVPTLEIWGSSQCNLKCKECCNRLPFVHQEDIKTDQVISSIGNLCRLAKLKRIIISGGEPFLNEDLYKLIIRISAIPEVEKIYILTNGTIIPYKKLLSAMVKSEKPIMVVMNEYQGVPNRIQEIETVLKERGTYKWNGIGNDIVRPMHFETARMIYADCQMRKYAVLYEDILTKCPRGVVFRKDLPASSGEYLHVSKLRNHAVSRAKLAACLDSNIHKEYCKLCFGLSKENPYLDEPGIQLKVCGSGEKQ